MHNKEYISDIVKSISDQLVTDKNYIINNCNIGLLSGMSGISFFLLNAFNYTKESKYEEIGVLFLENSLSKLNYNTPVSFLDGITGLGWTIDYLSNNNIVDNTIIDLLDTIDDFVENKIDDFMDPKNFDFFYGPTGMLLYFLKRDNKPYVNSIVNSYINLLKQNSKSYIGKNGKNSISFKHYGNWYDFGVAHGIPGVVLILLKIYEKYGNILDIQALITGYLNFILDNKIDDNNDSLLFPIAVEESGEVRTSYKIGWCYGNLGIGIAFLKAGIILKNDGLYNKGLNICLATSLKRDLDQQSIKDTCLCHGTAGLVSMYNRVAKYTSNTTLLKTRDFWINETLQFYRHDKITGFSFFDGNEKILKYDVLNGIAGVGLSLLASINELEDMKWDEMFLLS